MDVGFIRRGEKMKVENGILMINLKEEAKNFVDCVADRYGNIEIDHYDFFIETKCREYLEMDYTDRLEQSIRDEVKSRYPDIEGLD